ncbi:S8 family serine peptidase [Streptomyces sp. NPDC058525]|uniref:S8 family peptidase n=1 Tax=unclassified Streptomyces TaxID=2593676 RepID=UPI0036508EA1
MRLLAARVTAAAVIALTPVAAGTATAAAPEPTPAPLLTTANAIPNDYVVSLNRGVDPVRFVQEAGVKAKFTYTAAFNGFAATLTEQQLRTIRHTYGVRGVAQDGTVTAPPTPAKDVQSKSPANSWGLDRIDQRYLPLDGNFSANNSAQEVTAYILDTGIEYNHAEFRERLGTRARLGFDAFGGTGADCNGHGTHVAGTVGGTTVGVARKVKLVSVRVLNCEGTGPWSGIIAGFDWVARNARQPAVLNASLGGARYLPVNEAATAVSDRGVLPVIAAGNDNRNACDYSPASADLGDERHRNRVVTVGATNRFDEETPFSNWGPCLDIYAPGQDIISARLGGGTVPMSGTSMAAPHVAGVAALYKHDHPNALPAEVADFLDDESTKDIVENLSDDSPNKLLFTAGL